MNTEEIIKAYDALVERARAVVEGAPYWEHIYESYARVAIHGDTATIAWPRADHDYGGCSLETSTAHFPERLLGLSDDDFATWKIEKRAEYDRQQAAQKEEQRKIDEESQRRQYESLKAKFEG